MAIIPSAIPVSRDEARGGRDDAGDNGHGGVDIPTAQAHQQSEVHMQQMTPMITVVQFPCQACNSILQAPLGG